MTAAWTPMGRKKKRLKKSTPAKIQMVIPWVRASRPKPSPTPASHPIVRRPSMRASIARSSRYAVQLKRKSMSICGRPDIE